MYELRDVMKRYTQKNRIVDALRGVNLTIGEGELVAIQGPTGGGKSTLLQLLGAMDRPTSGSIALDGLELAGLSESARTDVRARTVGFVFQGFNLIPTLTAQQNVETGLVPLGLGAAERAERAAQALADVGLAERAAHMPDELSGGQQQRVAIARALAKRPRVLLADEPTGNLDERTRDEIMAMIERLWQDQGLTIVIVTHDSWVARRAQRQLWISDGVVTEKTGGRGPKASTATVR
ncbi:ABC transporter ATP-binding protein [Cellulomonas timonensis]|uniref:ABC transporter ATP-binding protein n=1 Tax=Cellulomonas timonensis TaxID=1689271 RepID=UPI00082A3EDD|nr:ABC transporter ATP-binding protein [Cellulomonas timonensis]